MSLLAIYAKTAKGLHQRKSLFGGLSSQLMSVLALVDGNASVGAILNQLSNISEEKLLATLKQLESEGYIKYLAESNGEEEWELGTVFSPMVVEEVFDEALPAVDEEQAEIDKEIYRLQDERRTREIEAQIREKEKAKAAAEQQAKLEAQRVAQEEAEKQKAAEVARLAAELQAQQAAQERAKLEAERVAKEAEEIRLKAEEEARVKAAEMQAKQEAEAHVRLEAERLAQEAEAKQQQAEAQLRKAELEAQSLIEKIRAKEKARREQVRLEKQAEAERKKVEAEAKAAEEARLADELQARQETEALTKAEMEAKAIAEAKERGRLEAERILRAQEDAQRQAEAAAQAEVEEEARIAAEIQAQQAAQARAELEAQRQAEAAAQAEVEEEARIAAEIQAQQEAQARAQAKEQEKLDKTRIAQEKADEKARLKAEEKARKEAERIAKKEREEALAAEKKAQKLAEKQAKEAAEQLSLEVNFGQTGRDQFDSSDDILDWKLLQAQQKRKSARKSIRLPAFFTPTQVKKWLVNCAKFSLVYLPILAIALLVLMHFVPLGMLVKPIENMASNSTGESVKIGSIYAALWPQPHFTLKNVAVGDKVNAESMQVVPVITTLFDENKVAKSVAIEGMDLDQSHFGTPLRWLNNASKATLLKVDAYSFKRVKLHIRDFELGTFDGDVRLNAERDLAIMEMQDAQQGISAEIKPQGDDFKVLISSKRWALPMHNKIVLEALQARGIYQQNQLHLNQVSGEIYGGKFDANVVLDWSSAWLASGDFKLHKVNTDNLLENFASTASVVGKLTLSGNFSGQSDTVAALKDAMSVNANFEIQNGKINGIDMPQAIVRPNDKSLEGYNTGFDMLSGSVQIKEGQFQYRNLVLKSPKMQAQGQLSIDAEQNISGKINANLATSTRNFQEVFNLTGKVANVKRK